MIQRNNNVFKNIFYPFIIPVIGVILIACGIVTKSIEIIEGIAKFVMRAISSIGKFITGSIRMGCRKNENNNNYDIISMYVAPAVEQKVGQRTINAIVLDNKILKIYSRMEYQGKDRGDIFIYDDHNNDNNMNNFMTKARNGAYPISYLRGDCKSLSEEEINRIKNDINACNALTPGQQQYLLKEITVYVRNPTKP